MKNKTVSIAVLMACHNRKALTLRILAQLEEAAARHGDLQTTTFLVDDASSDGTADEVSRQFPNVALVAGSGSLFWSRGMVLAFKTARTVRQDWDYYLLLNDDLDLDVNAFATVIRDCHAHNATNATIMVGLVRGPDGEVTYGGFARQSRRRPMQVSRVSVRQSEVAPADTFNANFVVLPASLMEALGGLDPAFHHAYGDIDIGFRAKALNARILVHGKSVGITPNHPEPPRPASALSRFLQRAGTMPRKPDGFRQYAVFMWRHGCWWMFPLYAAKYAFKSSCRLIYRKLKARMT
ncbi:MAG: glycosyltransferase family 2 protein [Microcystis sp. M_OC_Ca_00000000_S217Cul]|uniref:glycosyltransferase family 2 protein n=1 Tax=Microcystis sp. M_OC_Ca_00000000_S217Cul TaxID=2486214 RepID=UPI001196754F|nr:glycosyltransferase [Microcystis sp. M_OC_Ca_00000000_S217Cul]TRT69736.1 MAG: glycosyltransferase family 2 protein [Microcystis sp. M_OC_Ca_00000000_S217Cul]